MTNMYTSGTKIYTLVVTKVQRVLFKPCVPFNLRVVYYINHLMKYFDQIMLITHFKDSIFQFSHKSCISRLHSHDQMHLSISSINF